MGITIAIYRPPLGRTPAKGTGPCPPKEVPLMIALGAILLIIGFIAKISILWTLGIILLLVGVVLAVLGGTGRRVGGRAHWF